MSAVVGLDLSLTSTGHARFVDSRLEYVGNVKSKGKAGATYGDSSKRIEALASDIEVAALHYVELPDLVVIESPSYGSNTGMVHERAGLWWAVYNRVAALGIPIATVAPSTRAKYITGDGRAKKPVVLAFAIESYVRESGPRIPNDDVADAAGMAAMGSRWLGEPCELRALSADQLACMKTAKWPEVAA